MRRLGVLALLLAGCSRSFTSPGASSALFAAVDKTAVAPGETATLSVSRGRPPYAVEFLNKAAASGPGASLTPVDGSTWRYIAGAQGSATDQVQVRDSANALQIVPIVVGARLAIAAPKTTLARGESVVVQVSGGKPGYTLRADEGCFADGDGGCTGELSMVGGSATFTATRRADALGDGIQVTDAVDAGARLDLAFGPAVTTLPADVDVAPGQQLTLQASGGLPPYTFRFAAHGNLSGGQLSSGAVYVAGPNADVVDEIEAVDSVGSVGLTHVHVHDLVFQLPTQGDYTLYRANLNGDTFGDALAVSTNANFHLVQTYFGGPTGLTPLQSLAPSQRVISVLLGDFNGDGMDDLVLGTAAANGDPEGYDLLLSSSTGLLTPYARLPVHPPASGGGPNANGALLGAPGVVHTGSGPDLLAFNTMSQDATNPTAAVALFALPSAPGTFDTRVGQLPLVQQGEIAEEKFLAHFPDGGAADDFLATPGNALTLLLGPGPAAGSLTAYEIQNHSSGSETDMLACMDCDALGAGRTCPITRVDLLGPAGDGGAVPVSASHLCAPRCVDCETSGQLRLDVAELEPGQPSIILAQTAPVSSGVVQVASASLSPLAPLALPPALGVDVAPPPPGSSEPASIDVASAAGVVRYVLDNGALQGSALALSSVPVQAVEIAVSGRGVNDLVTLDDRAQLAYVAQGIHGRFGEGNSFAFIPKPVDVSSGGGCVGLVLGCLLDRGRLYAASDLDGDGVQDLVVGGRELSVFSGTRRRGLGSNPPAQRGANNFAVTGGFSRDAWALVQTASDGPALTRVFQREDGGYGASNFALGTLWGDGGRDVTPLAVDAIALSNGRTELFVSARREGDSFANALVSDPDAGVTALRASIHGDGGYNPFAPLQGVGDDYATVAELFGTVGDRHLGLFRPDLTGDYTIAPQVFPDPNGGTCWGWNGDLHAFARTADGGPDHLAGTLTHYDYCLTPMDWPWIADAKNLSIQVLDSEPAFSDLSTINFDGTADLDRNGVTDLIYRVQRASTQLNDVVVGWGRGDGTFRFAPLGFQTPLLANLERVVPGDFDGDGNPDLALVFQTNGQGATSVLYGLGDGGFE